MSIQSAYQEEAEHLEATIREIDRQLAGVGPRYYGSEFTEQVLNAQREEARKRLASLAEEPYFGRLDFQETGRSKPIPLYIGKAGVERPDDSTPMVLDWRAPAASMFYSFTGGDEGKAEYDAPDGIVGGIVHRKRNLAVRKRTLQRVVDSYVRGGDQLGVSDEFLLYRLGETKDNKLRDIVSTIQAEQDRIIRAPKNSALVIQGVAGSGKTTVALHRLAFLIYRYQEQMRAERMIIFAPNAMFLDYISGVLPELGVGHIRQTTFADWAVEKLEREVNVTDDRATFDRWFAVGAKRPAITDHTPGRFKGSLHFRQWLDEALDAFEAASVPTEDFVPWDGRRLPAETIRDWFEREYRHYPLAQRAERTYARMNRWLEMELARVPEGSRRKELQKQGRQKLKSYRKKLPVVSVPEWYRSLFDTAKPPAFLPASLRERLPVSVAEWTRKRVVKDRVDPEDLAPLLWIRFRMYGLESPAFDHIVVDEAQDFSPFQIALLAAHTREPSFTILGDLSQGIHAYRGIHRWQEMLEVFPEELRSFHLLEQSYRSTTEIIRMANHVLARSGEELPLARPVFRSGEPVSIVRLHDRTGAAAYIARRLSEPDAAHADSVAVIGRTAADCERLHADLAEAGVEATLIRDGQTEYRGGVSVIPVYLAKGLEFDEVIVAGADSANYGANAADAKLLYVACTRALHRLTLIHGGKPSPLIDDAADVRHMDV